MELLTGGFYEPILSAISDEDKIDQIRKLSGFLEERFRVQAGTAWLARTTMSSCHP